MADSGLIRGVIWFVALFISVMLHEICHAASAYVMGDSTGKNDGRISLNPLRHIDPFNTIMLPIICLLTMGFAFGGAKPVRINPLNFRNPNLGFALSSLAGPVCNILLAFASFVILFGLYSTMPDFVHPKSYNALFFGSMIFINLLLAVFNLIPIPPLDGSRVLRLFLPSPLKAIIDSIEPFGLFILIFLIMGGGVSVIIIPFLQIMEVFMLKVFDFGYAVEFLRNIGFYV